MKNNSRDKCVCTCVCLIKPNSWPNKVRYVLTLPVGIFYLLQDWQTGGWACLRKSRLPHPSVPGQKRSHAPHQSLLDINPWGSLVLRLMKGCFTGLWTQVCGFQSSDWNNDGLKGSGSFLWSSWSLCHVTWGQ